MIFVFKDIIWQNKHRELSNNLPNFFEIELNDDEIEVFSDLFPDMPDFIKFMLNIINTDEGDSIFDCDCLVGDTEEELLTLH